MPPMAIWSPLREADSCDGNAVDECGASPERQVFDIDATGDEMEGGVTPADFGIAKEVDLAVGGAADVSWIAVEDELLAGDESGGHAEPVGFGGAFDKAGRRPRHLAADRAQRDQTTRLRPRNVFDRIEEHSAQQASDQAPVSAPIVNLRHVVQQHARPDRQKKAQ